KKGLPVDDVPAEAPSTKKRRTAAKPEKSTKGRREATSKKVATSKSTANQTKGTKKVADPSENGKKVTEVKAKKAPVPEPDSDEEMDDEFGASDLDDMSDSGSDVEKLGDDFLGSDDSVYDSDQENTKREKFVFSDDEDDDDDREEK